MPKNLYSLNGILGLLIATGLVMNCRIFLGDYEFNFNMADIPTAILGMVTLLSLGWGIIHPKRWLYPHLRWALVVMGLVVLFGFLHGLWVLGLVKWALVARLIGWVVCLGFFMAGMALKWQFGNISARFWVNATALAILLAIIIEYYLKKTHGFWYQYPADSFRFYGLILNPNAYSFFILLTLVIMTYLYKNPQWYNLAMGGVLGIGMIITISATGWVVMGFVGLLMVWFRPRFILGAVLATMVLFALLYGMELIINHFTGLNEFIIIQGTQMQHGFTEVNEERSALFWDGLDLFLANPILGAGLGAFIHNQYQTIGEYHTIHNGFMWLLAEFGLVGMVLFLTPAWVIIKEFFQFHWNWLLNHHKLIMVLLGVLALFSLPHDMFYQRIFWFYWGFFVARRVV